MRIAKARGIVRASWLDSVAASGLKLALALVLLVSGAAHAGVLNSALQAAKVAKTAKVAKAVVIAAGALLLADSTEARSLAQVAQTSLDAGAYGPAMAQATRLADHMRAPHDQPTVKRLLDARDGLANAPRHGRPEAALVLHQELGRIGARWLPRYTAMADIVKALQAQHGDLLRTLAQVDYVPTSVTQLTARQAQMYAAASLRGGTQPGRFAAAEHASHADILARWHSAPESKRLMIMATSKDLALVNRVRQHAKAAGLEVFFYLDCAELAGVLCSSEQVAAMARTAGEVLFIDSEAAKASLFIGPELRAAQASRAASSTGVLFTPPT